MFLVKVMMALFLDFLTFGCPELWDGDGSVPDLIHAFSRRASIPL
jgi:hypothetical protein